MPDGSDDQEEDARTGGSAEDADEPVASDTEITRAEEESERSTRDDEGEESLEDDSEMGTQDESGDGRSDATDSDEEVNGTGSDDEDNGTEPDEETPDAEAQNGDESATEPSDADEVDVAQPEPKTDGEGYVGDRPEESHDEPEYPDPDDDIGGISTPPDDEEMPLADHIEEMVLRFAVVILVGAAGTAIGLLWASETILFIWEDVVPQASERPPHIYHPLELWLTRIKVSALLGIILALPMFIYECYLFMRPGLYPNERKYYIAAVPTSAILAGLGMIFSYLVVLPILFSYFTFYSQESADIAYALGETFDLVITLTGFLAIVFQIPLFIMLAIMLGVTTRKWLAQKRLYFWAAFAGLSFMFTMDPTLMAPIFVAITMILLFEGTLLLLKWTGQE